ncbi:MAG: OsmC family protein [Deltaproteobacteria bacterium]|nr:OsmC family protein [Deltaproteobacteria bacterium]
MPVRIDVAYEGDLQCSAVHGPTGTRLMTDAPVDNSGKGRTFSPTDLVAAAIGGCTLTIMGILARDRDLPFAGARVQVDKEMTSERPRRIARLGLRLTLPAALGPEDRQRLENAARACPVARSLHPDTRLDLQFIYE